MSGILIGPISVKSDDTTKDTNKKNNGSAEAPLPKWRESMKEPNIIYDISDNTLISLKFTFPGGVIPTQFSNSDGEPGTGGTIFGYGGGALF